MSVRPEVGLTPSAARRRLGGELQRARSRARLSLGDAAAVIERSAATLSRLENGLTVPRLMDVKALVSHYQTIATKALANGTEERILRLAELARREEWFASFRDVLAGELTSAEARRLVEFEGAATAIRTYEPEVVPGLLQTEEYAAAMTAVLSPDHAETERQRKVEFRLGRQHILSRTEEPVELQAVIGEAALYRVLGSAASMHEQLDLLLGYVRGNKPNIMVRIAPLTMVTAALLGGPFAQMDLASEDESEVVYLEGREAAQFVRTADDVDRYRAMFDNLMASLSDAERSAELIEVAIKRQS